MAPAADTTASAPHRATGNAARDFCRDHLQRDAHHQAMGLWRRVGRTSLNGREISRLTGGIGCRSLAADGWDGLGRGRLGPFAEFLIGFEAKLNEYVERLRASG